MTKVVGEHNYEDFRPKIWEKGFVRPNECLLVSRSNWIEIYVLFDIIFIFAYIYGEEFYEEVTIYFLCLKRLLKVWNTFKKLSKYFSNQLLNFKNYLWHFKSSYKYDLILFSFLMEKYYWPRIIREKNFNFIKDWHGRILIFFRTEDQEKPRLSNKLEDQRDKVRKVWGMTSLSKMKSHELFNGNET